MLGVQIAPAVGQIVAREQHLRDVPSARREDLLVVRHEVDLADGRGGLFLRNRLRPLAEAEPRHAGGDGAGGDDDELPLFAREILDLGGERADARAVEAGRRREQARAHLDHDATHAPQEALVRELARRGPLESGFVLGLAPEPSKRDPELRDELARAVAGRRRDRQRSRRRARRARRPTSSRRSRASTRSILFATTTCGLRGERGIEERELAVDLIEVVDRVAPAHRREIEHVDEQARAREMAQEAIAEPFAACAPGIRPGTSATTNELPLRARTTPRFGTSVVNG